MCQKICTLLESVVSLYHKQTSNIMIQSYFERLASATAEHELSELAQSLFDVEEGLEMGLTLAHFKNENAVYDFFNLNDWAEEIGLLSQPLPTDVFFRLRTASKEILNLFLADYQTFIKEFTEKQKQIARNSYDAEARENALDLLLYLKEVEAPAAKEFFN